MTKLLFCLAACFIVNLSVAQSLAPEVIATSGTSFNNGTSQLDWTLGEPATLTHNTGSNNLTQGFHQPNLSVTAINTLETTFSVTIFPNPSTDYIQIHFKDLKTNVTIELFSSDGKLLESKKINNNEIRLDMTSYKAGAYLLSVKDEHSKIKNYQVIKSN
jgi:hypothetical protein